MRLEGLITQPNKKPVEPLIPQDVEENTMAPQPKKQRQTKKTKAIAAVRFRHM